MNKAVFLDRDGVINRERGEWVYRIDDFEINADITESLRVLQKKGFIFIVVTNQSGIAKGVYRHKDVENIHGYMEQYFRDRGIEIKETFYCPHHDDTGRCLCRKPGSLMLEKAIARYNIVVPESFMVGDKERDIEAAGRVGVKGILIKPNGSILKIAEGIGG